MRKVRKYDKEFKINAVKHYENSGKSLKEVSDNLGIPDSTLRDWIKEYQENREQYQSTSKTNTVISTLTLLMDL